jgi:D-glycero-alpha-D-manno-heptose-7-phosphate kinase
MSFVGGGSDMSSFYEQEPGAVISTSIDKYIYIALNKKFDGDFRVAYSKTENTPTIDAIEHPIVRASLKFCKIDSGLEIVSLADIPASGTGLGSSSSFTVGLLKALYSYQSVKKSNEDLAREACIIEIDKCAEPIGKQDQYAAACGGINVFRFLPNGEVVIEPCLVSPKRTATFNDNILMVYTGQTRSASELLRVQSRALKEDAARRQSMIRMVELVDDFKHELVDGNLENIGDILDENWRIKSQLSGDSAFTWINDAYDAAIKAGALGGKILGAGNGGFFIFYSPKERHENIMKSLPGFERFDFSFENLGTQLMIGNAQ